MPGGGVYNRAENLIRDATDGTPIVCLTTTAGAFGTPPTYATISNGVVKNHTDTDEIEFVKPGLYYIEGQIHVDGTATALVVTETYYLSLVKNDTAAAATDPATCASVGGTDDQLRLNVGGIYRMAEGDTIRLNPTASAGTQALVYANSWLRITQIGV